MSYYEKEQARLLALWEEMKDDDDEYVDSEDNEELDHLSVHSYHSDGEDYGENITEDAESVPRDELEGDFYMGKDSVTKWYIQYSNNRIRTRAENIISQLPGSKPYAANAKSPIDCWLLFFDLATLDDITTCTNIMIRKKAPAYKDKQYCSDTNIVEIKAMFGILYLAGVYRSSHRNLRDLWRTNGTGIDIFRTVMAFNRFSFLLQCLRFDNIENRQERLQLDKLAPIRAVFDKFVSNCQQAYTPGQYITIDEKLESFRGRCSFRQYIPNKPAKYGIKIQALVDARTFYVYNMEVYAGVQPDGTYRVSNKPIDVVQRLVAPISGSHRNITFDNWYTSYDMVNILREKYGLTSVGTLRKNKAQIPLELLQTRNRQPKSSMFAFQKDITIISYVPKKGKNVILLSSLHHDDAIDESSGDKRLPEIVSFYNFTKGGVDTVDELSGSYSVARNCRRWPLRIFFSLMDTAGINSQIIYRANTDNISMKRRIFLEELGLALVQPTMHARKNNPRLSTNLRSKILSMLGETNPPPPKRQNTGRGRCQECPRNKDRKSQYTCEQCGKFFCLEHLHFFCVNCSNSHDA